jgi:hypothetical protein
MKPHKHAELIKAWADGAKIEFWSNYTNRWEEDISPCWMESLEYRIKPEPKPNVVELIWSERMGRHIFIKWKNDTSIIEKAEVLK